MLYFYTQGITHNLYYPDFAFLPRLIHALYMEGFTIFIPNHYGWSTGFYTDPTFIIDAIMMLFIAKPTVIFLFSFGFKSVILFTYIYLLGNVIFKVKNFVIHILNFLLAWLILFAPYIPYIAQYAAFNSFFNDQIFNHFTLLLYSAITILLFTKYYQKIYANLFLQILFYFSLVYFPTIDRFAYAAFLLPYGILFTLFIKDNTLKIFKAPLLIFPGIGYFIPTFFYQQFVSEGKRAFGFFNQYYYSMWIYFWVLCFIFIILFLLEKKLHIIQKIKNTPTLQNIYFFSLFFGSILVFSVITYMGQGRARYGSGSLLLIISLIPFISLPLIKKYFSHFFQTLQILIFKYYKINIVIILILCSITFTSTLFLYKNFRKTYGYASKTQINTLNNMLQCISKTSHPSNDKKVISIVTTYNFIVLETFANNKIRVFSFNPQYNVPLTITNNPPYFILLPSNDIQKTKKFVENIMGKAKTITVCGDAILFDYSNLSKKQLIQNIPKI